MELGRKNNAKLLLDHDANVNQQDSRGWSPLHYAVDTNGNCFAFIFLK